MSQPAKRRKHRKPDPYAATSAVTELGPFYKILREDLTHHGFTYQPGLNVDTKPFEPCARCFGGLYFSDLEHIARYLEYGDLVARVTVPPDAHFIQEKPGKFKADRVILSDLQPWRDWDLWNDATFVEHAVQQDAMVLEHVQHQTPELCLAAVQQDGLALQHVQHQTPELCLAAMQENGCALQYVKNQTREICLVAVQQDGHALQHVKNQTREICLVAMQQHISALQYVQHPEICLAAIRQNPIARFYVKDCTHLKAKQHVDSGMTSVRRLQISLPVASARSSRRKKRA